MIEAESCHKLKTWKDAAQHCGVPERYLRNQTKAGNGPKYLQPSTRTILFRTQDLDEWVASWKVVGRRCCKESETQCDTNVELQDYSRALDSY